MKERVSSISSKGQVTIPVEIRRLLGLAAQDKVSFIVEGNKVRLEAKHGSVVARTAGAFKSGRPAPSAEALRLEAEVAIADAAEARASY